LKDSSKTNVAVSAKKGAIAVFITTVLQEKARQVTPL
jgi:hypothetical protein